MKRSCRFNALLIYACLNSGALAGQLTFCQSAQRLVANTNLTAINVIHGDFDQFVLSKAAIRPLTTQQYMWYEDEARSRLVAVSCKLKTADHLNSEYGDGAAGPERTCRDFNEATVEAVAAELTAEERNAFFQRFRELILQDDLDTVTTSSAGLAGPDWLAPYEPAWVGEEGVLHVKAKALVAKWTDPRFQDAAPRFRGNHYCHLIAPEYLKRLAVGDSEPGISIGRLVDRTTPPSR